MLSRGFSLRKKNEIFRVLLAEPAEPGVCRGGNGTVTKKRFVLIFMSVLLSLLLGLNIVENKGKRRDESCSETATRETQRSRAAHQQIRSVGLPSRRGEGFLGFFEAAFQEKRFC